MDYFNYHRRKSSVTRIGNTPLGGENPVRIQSMTNTRTQETLPCVEQSIRIIDAGADYVRLTAQGTKEAENLANIEKELHKRGYHTPLIADIHFNPNVADAAARIVEKVRINPGNFVDSARTFVHLEYTDEEYAEEIKKLRARFIQFLDICKEHHTAVRIGVNHGSLSDRIMSRYGDTPAGIVESCMEFLRVCKEENFNDVVLSIKASNTGIMIKSVRLLIAKMEQEGMNYPLHLGVTEAGDGEDGRIKSAVGIGTLLADGIGDTIRVSLSEAPEAEIPVARKLVDYITNREGHTPIKGKTYPHFDFLRMERRKSKIIGNIGGNNVPVTIANALEKNVDIIGIIGEQYPDYWYIGNNDPNKYPNTAARIVDADVYVPQPNVYPLFTTKSAGLIPSIKAKTKFLLFSYPQLDETLWRILKENDDIIAVLTSDHKNPVGEQRAFFHELLCRGLDTPVILQQNYTENDNEDLQIKAGADFGALLSDGFGDGVWLQNQGNISTEAEICCMYGILQAVRQRISKTEYISCPGCGRTLFDLQKTIAKVKAATSHLKGLKIGIMGCIVNGPGEMADVDYGYVGAGRDRISLYKNKVCIEKNIPEEQAVEKLIELIKINGDWKDK